MICNYHTNSYLKARLPFIAGKKTPGKKLCDALLTYIYICIKTYFRYAF